MHCCNDITTELAGARVDAEALLDKDCIIKRTISSEGDYGTDDSDEFEVIETTRAGLAEPSAAQLAIYGEKLGAMGTWIVKLPLTSTVRAQDIMLIDGQELIAQRRLEPRSHALLLRVYATQIR